MTPTQVTVALPVLDGERWLDETLAAVRAQRVDRELELLVADSGSRDRSREIVRSHGGRVIEVESFSHGGTRNLLMAEAERRARGVPHAGLAARRPALAGAAAVGLQAGG